MAKKKKDTPKKVVANEVVEEKEVIEGDIVDLMKEVSMQEEVSTVLDDIKINENEETVEDKNEVTEVNENNETVENISAEGDNGIIEITVNEPTNDEVCVSENLEQISEKIESILENISVDEVIEDVRNNNDTKPIMTYKQMMGYDWNGQNFDYV